MSVSRLFPVSVLAALAALAFAGCDPDFAQGVGRRVDALDDSLWAQSEWISVKEAKVHPASDGGKMTDRAAPGTSWFVRVVENGGEIRRAVWMTTALGVYDVYVNGLRVGNDFLKPGFTHVGKTRRSFTYDVTAALKPAKGEANVFAAEVSAGWWRDKIVNFKGRKSAFRAVLRLEYADGRTETVGTDAATWQSTVGGPVKEAGIFDGEVCDANVPVPLYGGRAELKGTTERNEEFKGEILPSDGGEVTLRTDLAVVRGPFKMLPGVPVTLDFGQNCAAIPAFRFRAKRGVRLTCLPAEMLNDANRGERGCDGPKGTIYRANLRTPLTGMTLRYTFAGNSEGETYWPRFTFFGYRYVELKATGEVEVEWIAQVPVTSIAKEMEIGSFTCGDKALDRFVRNVYWGQLSNYLSVPTDCPQRNERLGWTADTQVFADAGAYNADTRAFFRKWMRDLRDTQAPEGGFPSVAPYAQYGSEESMRLGWADVGVIVPWKIWRQFGDRSIVDENWESMERFMKRVNDTRYEYFLIQNDCRRYQYADWVSLEKLESCSGAAYMKENGKTVPRPEAIEYWDYLGGCYWALDAEMMREMAAATGRDAAKYEKMHAKAIAYLKDRFFKTPDKTIRPLLADMQTPAVFALKTGLVEGEAKAKTIAALRASLEKNGNLTGFLGATMIMDVLCENGMPDLALDLMLRHEFPSWLYSVDQGATTIWERWNGWTKEKGFGPVSMNSYNHYAYGAVYAWMMRYLAGIAPDTAAPGFKRIVMKPLFDKRIGFVKAEYRSAAGPIRSEWRYEGDTVVWKFSIPDGATALVTLPGGTKAEAYPAGDHEIRL